MGLTIYYSATIKDRNHLKYMTDEVTDICRSMGWTYHILDDDVALSPEVTSHLGLPMAEPGLPYYGIIFRTHPRCEDIYLTFLEGKLVMPAAIRFVDPETDPEHFYIGFTKTQFAGPEVHATIIRLFKYLEIKYLNFDRFVDETGFWDTGDPEDLHRSFNRMNFIFDRVEDALSNLTVKGVENTADLLTRLENALRKLPGTFGNQRTDSQP
jgi:hypothetical protein